VTDVKSLEGEFVMRPGHTKRLAATSLALVLVWCLLGPTEPALAQAGWTGIITEISSGGGAKVAFDAGGNAFAVWSAPSGTTRILRAARYTAATERWSNPTDISDEAPVDFYFDSLEIAVSDGGDAVVVWRELLASWDEFVGSAFTARYSANSGTWTPPFEINDGYPVEPAIDNSGNVILVWSEWGWAGGFIKAARSAAAGWIFETIAEPGMWRPIAPPQIAVDGAGNAIVVFASGMIPNQHVQAISHAATTGLWTSPVNISAAIPNSPTLWPQLAVDRSGNAVVMWIDYFDATEKTQATRYDATTSAWSAVKDLSTGVGLHPHYPRGPVLDADDQGNVVAVWFEVTTRKIRSAAYMRASDNWTHISNVGEVAGSAEPQIAIDSAGNATVLWSFFPPGGPSSASVTRRTAAGSWSPASGPFAISSPHLAVDQVGNAMVVFNRFPASANVQSTRWLASPAAPTIVAVTPGNGALTVAFQAPAAEPGFSNTNYEYSTDDGATWTTRAPASTGSPLTITGLAAGHTHAIRLRGVNHAGAGIASPSFIAATGPPSAPTGLLGLADGSRVTLIWQNTFSGGAPTGIVLDVSGDTTGSIPLPLTDRFASGGVPPGTYTVTARAVNSFGSSSPSNAVTLTFPGPCSPPSTPTNFTASKSGHTITVSWLPPSAGAAPAGYVVLVSGSFEGEIPTTALMLSGAAGPGTYSLSVAATNVCGTSGATPAQTITIP
jgi:hypothetical protein